MAAVFGVDTVAGAGGWTARGCDRVRTTWRERFGVLVVRVAFVFGVTRAREGGVAAGGGGGVAGGGGAGGAGGGGAAAAARPGS